MPGCVLRISVGEGDLDELLRSAPFEPCAVFRRGERKSSNSRHTVLQSGFNVAVTDDGNAPFAEQCEKAREFLASHSGFIQQVAAQPGAGVSLDFGVSADLTDERPISSFTFPRALMRVAADLDVDVGLTIYPTRDQ